MTGLIFDIQKFALNDGPGIRTVVFFKGCPLRCIWCHNPESWEAKIDISFASEKCIGCQWCVKVCPQHCHSLGKNHVFNRNDCIHCGKCTERCFAEALSLIGKNMTVDEVMTEVEKDISFYRNSGGLTLSGGEPLAQANFALELLKQAKAIPIHTAVETCAYVSWEKLKKLLPYTDLFLFDIKATDPEKHRRFTGVSNTVILRNLRKLDASNAQIVLRCPLVPGVNDDIEHLQGIAELAESMKNIRRIDVEPFHPLGTSKHERLGTKSSMEKCDFTSETQMRFYLKTIRSFTKTTTIIKN